MCVKWPKPDYLNLDIGLLFRSAEDSWWVTSKRSTKKQETVTALGKPNPQVSDLLLGDLVLKVLIVDIDCPIFTNYWKAS